jgi:uncharacterized protein YndB with AHSA1/START domain
MNDLKMTRTFDALREVVFNAWTDPKQIAKWFGPKNFTTTVLEHNAKPGGLSRIVMHGPDGNDYPGKAIFREVVRPERISMSSFVIDGNGNEVMETLITAIFEEKNKKTTLTVTVKLVKSTPEAAPYLSGMQEGWNQTLDKLVEVIGRK